MSLSLALSWEDHEADIAGRFAPFDAPRGFSRDERPTRQIRAFYGQKLRRARYLIRHGLVAWISSLMTSRPTAVRTIAV